MTASPTLTLITPVFNAAPFIAETIESVLNQDVGGLEFIIADGGSNDGTVDVIRKYEKHLAWWVSEKDGGQAAAFNKACAKATGDFVAEVDGDDVYLPGALQAMLGYLTEHPEARWIAGGVLGFGTGGVARNEWHMPLVPKSVLDCVTINFQAATPGHIWSRAMFLEAGGYDESMRYLFDFELFAKLLSRGERCIPIDRPVAAYRFHPDSKTIAEIDKFEAEWDRIRARYVPALPFHERVIAGHRIAMHKSGALYTASANSLADGKSSEARAQFARAFGAYPPSIFGRNGLGATKRLLKSLVVPAKTGV
jgi:glycosyltransferase involved in cell wall biosynthesis